MNQNSSISFLHRLNPRTNQNFQNWWCLRLLVLSSLRFSHWASRNILAQFLLWSSTIKEIINQSGSSWNIYWFSA